MVGLGHLGMPQKPLCKKIALKSEF